MYEIEKNVPLVNKYRTMRKYPFDGMEVGDSFVVPDRERVNALRAMTLTNRKGDGRRFSSRRQLDGSIRIWRTQ